MLNLALNASQAFLEPRRPSNKIWIRSRTSGDNAVIEISDNGPGIPPDLLQKIFEPFFTTKSAEIGTGLGLYLSRNLVEDTIGGTLEVFSTLGEGATFRITLPAHMDTEASEPQEKDVIETPKTRPRVLIVDDEVAIGRALRRLLDERCEVVCANTGLQAIDLLESSAPFSLILSDLIMPDMDGLAFYQQLTARWPDMANHLVFMTGGTYAPQTEAFLAKQTVLHKPFTATQLFAIIQDYAKT